MAHNLSSKAMVVSLGFSAYGANKTDKARSKELTENNGAAKNRASVTKRLIDMKQEKSFGAISAHKQSMMLYHRSVSLPWFNDGSRIIPCARFEEYSRTMRKMQEEYWRLVNDFVSEYPAIVQREQARYSKLGSLWNESDYIDASEVKSKFNVSLHVYPLPDIDDFRVSMHDDSINELKAEYENSFNSLMNEAKKELFQRLYDVVSTLADNIREPDKKFKDASVNNICKLVDMLSDLNISGDSDIEAMRTKIHDKVCVEDIGKLRTDKEYRKEISKEADDLLNDMAGYLA